jgi:hypothetical protein
MALADDIHRGFSKSKDITSLEHEARTLRITSTRSTPTILVPNQLAR